MRDKLRQELVKYEKSLNKINEDYISTFHMNKIVGEYLRETIRNEKGKIDKEIEIIKIKIELGIE